MYLLLNLEGFCSDKSCLWISIKKIILFSTYVGADVFVGPATLMLYEYVGIWHICFPPKFSFPCLEF
jgi:hypothetical protein